MNRNRWDNLISHKKKNICFCHYAGRLSLGYSHDDTSYLCVEKNVRISPREILCYTKTSYKLLDRPDHTQH